MNRRFRKKAVLAAVMLLLSGCVHAQEEQPFTESNMTGNGAADAESTSECTLTEKQPISADGETDPAEGTEAAASILGVNATDNNEKTLFQAYFDGNSYPADGDIMEVNMQAESGNYRVTVCDVLIDSICSYFLVKLETIDGNALPSGNLSMAPESYSSLLTDIYLDYMVSIQNTNGRRFENGSILCDRIDNGEEEDTAYFIIGGDNRVWDLESVYAEPDMVFLEINSITIYRPYYGAVVGGEETEEGEKTEEVLVRENLEFDIPVTSAVSGSIRTFTNGSEGYLSANGFCVATDLNMQEDRLYWMITFEDGSVLRSKDMKEVGTSGLSGDGFVRLHWFGVYIDVDKISVITINGEEYKEE